MGGHKVRPYADPNTHLCTSGLYVRPKMNNEFIRIGLVSALRPLGGIFLLARPERLARALVGRSGFALLTRAKARPKWLSPFCRTTFFILSGVQIDSKQANKKKPPKGWYFFIGAPGEIRTPDQLVRSQLLYPTELRAHRIKAGIILRLNSAVKFR